MVQKTNKTKSRLGREFNGEYIDVPMGEGKTELLDSLIKKAKKKIKYVHEVGDKVEDLGEPRNLEIAEKCVSEEKAKFFRHLNNVMANKLIKPSIIMEYVNQYNISMGEE